MGHTLPVGTREGKKRAEGERTMPPPEGRLAVARFPNLAWNAISIQYLCIVN